MVLNRLPCPEYLAIEVIRHGASTLFKYWMSYLYFKNVLFGLERR